MRMNSREQSKRIDQGLNTPPKPNPGKSDGVFYFYRAAAVLGVGTCVALTPTVHARSSAGYQAMTQGRMASGSYWSSTRRWGRGMRSKLTSKESYSSSPILGRPGAISSESTPEWVPSPISPSKPGSEYNDLRSTRKREVVIVVNGVQVCDPVKLEYDITPFKIAARSVWTWEQMGRIRSARDS